MTVSVTGRAERDLVKEFEDVDIDWLVVERRLCRLGELFRGGKKPRVDLVFGYSDG